LFEGKCQPEAQLSLAFDEANEDADGATEGDSGVTVSFNGGPEMSMEQFEKATKKAVQRSGRKAKQEDEQGEF
jgi:hypothetical protein